jgi:hypothetical protein
LAEPPAAHRLLRFPDRANEPEAFAGRRADETLVFAAISNGDAGGVDAAGQRRFRDDPSVPDGFHDLVLADDPAAVLDEESENVEDLRLYGDRRARSQQFAPVGV